MANGHVDGHHRHDDAGAIAGDHRSDDRRSGPAIPDRYKLVLFNNEVLRLDSVSGLVWILDFERDPHSRQVVRPRWVVVEPASPSPDVAGEALQWALEDEVR